MANVDGKSGFTPINSPQGSVERNEYDITDDYAADLFIGDLVVRKAAGTVEIATVGAGNYVLGAIVGLVDETGVPQNYYPASSTAGWKAIVTDSPDQLYVAQEDGDTDDLALADRGQNLSPVAAAGSTSTGFSGWELDSDTHGTGATLQLKLISKIDKPDNALGDWCRWALKINYHQNADNVAGI